MLVGSLDGGLGADTLKGGAGNDIYVMDAGDTIDEESKTDLGDTIKANFLIASTVAGVENYTYTGSAAWTFTAGGVEYPAGSWIIPDQTGLRPVLEKAAEELDLDVTAGPLPDVRRHLLDLPRLGVLQTWDDTESAGWVRMIFDHEAVPYTLLMDEDLRKGGLKQRFDVILMPNTYSSLKDIVGGMDLEQALTSRDQINNALRGVLDEATGKWGIRVNRVELKGIDPPPSIKDSMEKQMRADRDKRAAILTAEGQRQAAILASWRVPQGQGWLFSKPLPADEFLARLPDASNAGVAALAS